MGQILHDCARTTKEIRLQIQRSKESITQLLKYFHLNRNTVRKWKNRDFINDTAMGTKNPNSTVLTDEEKKMIINFPRCTSLVLDNCLYVLERIIPKLTRSSLYRCLKRHSINRLQGSDNEKKTSKKGI